RILVIDDIANVREALYKFLSPTYEVLTAAGPADALRLWHQNENLLFCLVDLRLRDEQTREESEDVGFRLIDELLKRPGAVVAIRSAYSTPPNIQRAKGKGVHDFMPADIDVDQLMARLERLAPRSTGRALPGAIRPLSDDERCQNADHDWCLSQPYI